MVKYRKQVQFLFALIIFFALSFNWITIWMLLIIAVITGVIFGKVFCKWMCPIGFIKEIMNKNLTDEQSKVNMYNYYKLGCPISWIQGLLNKVSFVKIKLNTASCTSCGLCDRACYISSISKAHSFIKEGKSTPSEAFNCSKCLVCVDTCPNNSLTYTVKK